MMKLLLTWVFLATCSKTVIDYHYADGSTKAERNHMMKTLHKVSLNQHC